MMENTRDSGQKSVFGFSRVSGNDAGLTIHAQDSRVGWIHCQFVRHVDHVVAI